MLKGHGVFVSFASLNMSLANEIELVGVDDGRKRVGVFHGCVNHGAMDFLGVGEKECIDFTASNHHHLFLV